MFYIPLLKIFNMIGSVRNLVCGSGGALKAMLGVLSALVSADVAGCSRRELLALLVAPVHRLQEHSANAHHIKQVTHVYMVTDKQ